MSSIRQGKDSAENSPIAPWLIERASAALINLGAKPRFVRIDRNYRAFGLKESSLLCGVTKADWKQAEKILLEP